MREAVRAALAGEIDHLDAVRRVAPEDVEQVLHAQFDGGGEAVLATGLGASPGAAVGRVYFTADDCVAAADRGETA